VGLGAVSGGLVGSSAVRLASWVGGLTVAHDFLTDLQIC
jgi:hypothetical protein